MAPKVLSPAHASWLLILVLIAAAAGCGQPDVKTPAGGGAATGPTAAAVPARFQATVYEVHLSPTLVGGMDAKALAAKGATAADFEKALEGLGKTKALYQVDQSVNPVKDSILVGSRVPMVTGSRSSEQGGTINTVQYQQVGAIFKFAADPAKSTRKSVDLGLGVEISAIMDTGVEIVKGVKAAAIRSYTMTCTGPVELGRPFVFFSVDASVKDAEGNAVAYVCRSVLGEAKP